MQETFRKKRLSERERAVRKNRQTPHWLEYFIPFPKSPRSALYVLSFQSYEFFKKTKPRKLLHPP